MKTFQLASLSINFLLLFNIHETFDEIFFTIKSNSITRDMLN